MAAVWNSGRTAAARRVPENAKAASTSLGGMRPPKKRLVTSEKHPEGSLKARDAKT
jgi:hypothetical protein